MAVNHIIALLNYPLVYIHIYTYIYKYTYTYTYLYTYTFIYIHPHLRMGVLASRHVEKLPLGFIC